MVRFEWPDFPVSDATGRWLDDVQMYYLLPLEFEAAREGVAYDFTGASLQDHEELIIDFFGSEQELVQRLHSSDELRNLALGTMGYLGETLMRVGGGWWSNDEPSGSIPGGSLRVHLDLSLGLSPLAPADVLIEAVTRRDGRQFARACSMVEKAVAERHAQVPDWEPVKIRLLGLDPPPPSEFLNRWLAEREQTFPEWAAAHGEYGTWDFSATSLDALEELLRQQLTYVANDFANERERAMAEQSAWYLGEVMLRTGGGGWYYEPPTPGRPSKAGVGVPYVLRRPWHGARMYVEAAIQNMLNPERSLGFRERLARYTAEPEP